VLIVPTLRVGMHTVTLCVTVDAERPWRHSHAERGNGQQPGFQSVPYFGDRGPYSRPAGCPADSSRLLATPAIG